MPLAEQDVIEIRRIMHFAVMDVDRWKEQGAWIRLREIEGHGMQRVLAGLELEHSESVILVLRQRVPYILR